VRSHIKYKILGILFCREAKDFVFVIASGFHPKGFRLRKFHRYQPPRFFSCVNRVPFFGLDELPIQHFKFDGRFLGGFVECLRINPIEGGIEITIPHIVLHHSEFRHINNARGLADCLRISN